MTHRTVPPISGTASHSDRPIENAVPPAGMITLSLGALGVVFGDIGTSPLYTFAGVSARCGRQERACRGRIRHPLADGLGIDPGSHGEVPVFHFACGS